MKILILILLANWHGNWSWCFRCRLPSVQCWNRRLCCCQEVSTNCHRWRVLILHPSKSISLNIPVLICEFHLLTNTDGNYSSPRAKLSWCRGWIIRISSNISIRYELRDICTSLSSEWSFFFLFLDMNDLFLLCRTMHEVSLIIAELRAILGILKTVHCRPYWRNSARSPSLSLLFMWLRFFEA